MNLAHINVLTSISTKLCMFSNYLFVYFTSCAEAHKAESNECLPALSSATLSRSCVLSFWVWTSLVMFLGLDLSCDVFGFGPLL